MAMDGTLFFFLDASVMAGIAGSFTGA